MRTCFLLSIFVVGMATNLLAEGKPRPDWLKDSKTSSVVIAGKYKRTRPDGAIVCRGSGNCAIGTLINDGQGNHYTELSFPEIPFTVNVISYNVSNEFEADENGTLEPVRVATWVPWP